MLLLRNGVRLSLCYYPSSRESRLISYIGMLLASISGGWSSSGFLNLSRQSPTARCGLRVKPHGPAITMSYGRSHAPAALVLPLGAGHGTRGTRQEVRTEP